MFSTLEEAKQIMKNRAAEAFRLSLLAVPYPADTSKLIDLDESSQQNIIAADSIAYDAMNTFMTWNTDFYWRTADNNKLLLPRAADMRTFAQWAGTTVSAKTFNLFAHKDAIDALTTIEDVEAYDVSTGWDV